MTPAFQRHDLVWLDPGGDLESYAVNPEHASLVREWITGNNPTVVSRQQPLPTSAEPVLCLGFTRPPPFTRQRVSLQVPREMVTRHTGPLGLAATLPHAPEWHDMLKELVDMSNTVGVKTAVYGALSWQSLTGRTYLTGTSDIDLLFYCTEIASARRLCTALTAFGNARPRLDGEILSGSGWGTAWRELHNACHSGDDSLLLAKSTHSVQLLRTADFFDTAGG